MATRRVRIGILFGGRSEEHPVSVKSAQEVAAHLDSDRYEPVWVGITRSGAWQLCDGPDPDWEDRPGRPVVLTPDRSFGGLLVLDGARHEQVPLDVVFPVLHGKQGEDGAIQGLLELSGIPYVGCDVQGSAVCMDKSLAYVVAASAGIPTPEFRTISASDCVEPGRYRYPVFVKPARSGSSFGVTKVERAEDLHAAVRVARQYDSTVLVEQAVVGCEVGCAVQGYGEHLTVGELDQVGLTHGFFRIHQESAPESGSENATITVPAPIPDEQRDAVRATAKAIYRALGCGGLARVDMFLTDDGTVVLNEVNTMPGLTSYSRYPRMMAAAGMPMPDLIDRLVSSTLREASR